MQTYLLLKELVRIGTIRLLKVVDYNSIKYFRMILVRNDNTVNIHNKTR
jgi:hypothetical protein